MQVLVLIAKSSAAREARSIAAYEPAKSVSGEVLMSPVFICCAISNANSLRDDPLTKPIGQCVGCDHINRNTQKIAQLVPNGTQVKQRGVISGVHKEVQITFGRVQAM